MSQTWGGAGSDVYRNAIWVRPADANALFRLTLLVCGGGLHFDALSPRRVASTGREPIMRKHCQRNVGQKTQMAHVLVEPRDVYFSHLNKEDTLDVIDFLEAAAGGARVTMNGVDMMDWSVRRLVCCDV
jgi:hypothetical protein